MGVLLADNDAGRKKGAAISVDEVSPWLRSCKICRRRAFPSSLVWKIICKKQNNTSMYGFSLGQTQYVSNLSYTNLSLSKTVTLKNTKKVSSVLFLLFIKNINVLLFFFFLNNPSSFYSSDLHVTCDSGTINNCYCLHNPSKSRKEKIQIS